MQWPAVGAGTDPPGRARDLERGSERLLANGALGAELPPDATLGVRPTIVEWWLRSLTHDLTEQLRKLAEESRGMVVLTDSSGLIGPTHELESPTSPG